MKNLKPFKVNEGDWGEEPEAYTEYQEAKRDFITLATPSDTAILKKKSDGSLWCLDTTDIEEDHNHYLYYYRGGERAEGYEEEEYASIATGLFKGNNYKEGKEAWDDRDGVDRLFKLTPELAEELIEEFVTYSKPRAGARVWNTNPAMRRSEYKKGASVISKAFPEA